jgi:hypothetical protein
MFGNVSEAFFEIKQDADSDDNESRLLQKAHRLMACLQVKFPNALSRTGLPDVIHILKPKIPIWVNFGGP